MADDNDVERTTVVETDGGGGQTAVALVWTTASCSPSLPATK